MVARAGGRRRRAGLGGRARAAGPSRAPALARASRPCSSRSPGATAYAIALLSYTDNRSSTYLLLYVALPLLMAGALWLALLLRAPELALPRVRAAAASPSPLAVACC